MSEQNTENSQENADNKPSGGMVFYPRSYDIVQSIDDSYARGVNQDGEECIVYVRPTEAARAAASVSGSAKTVPTLMEFAEDGRRARNPCLSAPDNCQETPEGVFLVEQVVKHDDLSIKHNGLPVYVGRWASVLRDSSDVPKVPVGPGYIEIGMSSKVDSEINEYMTQYQELMGEIDAGVVDNMSDAEEQRIGLYNKIMAGRKKWFVAVMMRVKETVTMNEVSAESLKSVIQPILDKYTICGMYGGVMVRVRSDNTVISESCSSCNMQFDYKKGEPQKSGDVFENFMKFYGKKLIWAVKSNSYTVDIIPTIRINCGPKGTQKLDDQFKAGGTPKLLKTFVDRDAHDDPMANYIKSKSFLFANVALRLAVIGQNRSGAGNHLLSSVHAYSAPKGNIFTADAEGNPTYRMDNAKTKEELAQTA